jgi:hypothetical protein
VGALLLDSEELELRVFETSKRRSLSTRIVLVLISALVLIPSLLPASVDAADAITCKQPAAISGSGRTAVADGLTTLVKTLAACQSAGNWQTYSQLTTEKYLGQVYGGGGSLAREDFLALTDGMPIVPVRFRGFDDLKIVKPGEARANVKLIVGSQLTFEQLFFREETSKPGVWLLDSTRPLTPEPPRNHSDLDLAIAGNAYDPAALSAAGLDVRIRVSNADAVDHEVLILALADTATIGTLLISPGAGLPDGFTYMAQLTVPAQSDGSLVLVGMKQGTYAIVDLLPDANGVPYLGSGMQGTLTVTS